MPTQCPGFQCSSDNVLMSIMNTDHAVVVADEDNESISVLILCFVSAVVCSPVLLMATKSHESALCQ